MIPQGRPRRQSRKAPQGVAGDHRGASDAFAHIGHQLVTPKRSAIGQTGGFGTAPESEQIDGVHLMGACQHGDVVPPVIGGGTKTMHQQQRGTLQVVGLRHFAEPMHRVTLELPPGLLSLAHHNCCLGARC